MSDQATTLYQLALQAEPRPHARPRPGLPPQGPRLMVVTGVEAGVGTTTIAVQLARGLAQAGQTVVFLDADPRQAAASRQFGVSGRGQLGAWLAGGREV
ncbi:MAG: AAA family ATPase, partial [Planctomycetales bacterium]|nr:AAA family ATPase [Planctomycetales bacterium]